MSARLTAARQFVPGIVIAALVAGVAVALEKPLGSLIESVVGRRLSLPAMVIALLIGIALNGVASRPVFTPGIAFSVRTVLRCAVALLGIRISFADIAALGPGTALVVVTAMVTTLIAGVVLARLTGRDDPYGALAGAATAVCGASAALATSTVLPDYKDKAADVAFVVVACNALATVAMIAYPALCALIGLDARATGVMLGSTIHDVAQVAGAGYAVSDAVGNSAVIVKLFRVFLLLPVVVGVSVYFARSGGHVRTGKLPVPLFALVFLALVVVNSLGILPAFVTGALATASYWGLLLAIGALGLMTSFGDITRAGWRHLVVMLAVSAVVLVVATGGIMLISL